MSAMAEIGAIRALLAPLQRRQLRRKLLTVIVNELSTLVVNDFVNIVRGLDRYNNRRIMHTHVETAKV